MQKKILVVGMVIVLLLNAILVGNVSAIDSTVTLTREERCPDLLTFDGVTVGCVRVSYYNGSTTMPAYCLDRDLPGIGFNEGEKSQYDVQVYRYINDARIWRIISNSFPSVSFQTLGVKNIQEAFVATKQAIYCILYGGGEETYMSRYGAIGDAGQRTLNAMKKLVRIGRDGTDTMPSNVIDIVSESAKWEVDSIDKSYISKTYSINTDAYHTTYKVTVDTNEVPEGTIVTNINNKLVSSFSKGSKFKILIPINHGKAPRDFQVNVSAELLTNPVYFGDAGSSLQSYALQAYQYEEGSGSLTERFIRNDSKLTIIKKDGATGAFLSGTEFNILDANKKIRYSNLITNQRGEVVIDGMEPGTYFLQETKAREGYQKMNNLVEFKMELNKQITLTVNNNKVKQSTVESNSEGIDVNVNGSNVDVNISESNQNLNENNERTDVNVSQSESSKSETNRDTNVNVNSNKQNMDVTNNNTNVNMNNNEQNLDVNNKNTNVNVNSNEQNMDVNNENTNVNVNSNEQNMDVNNENTNINVNNNKENVDVNNKNTNVNVNNNEENVDINNGNTNVNVNDNELKVSTTNTNANGNNNENGVGLKVGKKLPKTGY